MGAIAPSSGSHDFRTGPVTQTREGVMPVSVVIPAHNEETVIGRCLAALFAGAGEGELDVVVVCNGCRDGT